MSRWSYINGVIRVMPLGRTQPEKKYILDTVLSHMPRVMGSEGDMDVYVNQEAGYNGTSNCDEFGDRTNNLVGMYGYKSRRHGWFETQDHYLLTVEGHLRDTTFEEAIRSFSKWLTRLSKRVIIDSVLVRISEPYVG